MAEAQSRVPPHNLDAEKSVLGAMMLSKRAGAAAMENLTPADFYFGAHARIFEAMETLFNAAKPIDLVTLSDRLEKDGVLEAVGGYAYVADISGFVPTPANVEQYIKIVKGHSLLRRMIDASGTISQDCFEASRETDEILSAAEKAVFDVSQQGMSRSFVHIRDSVNTVLAEIEQKYHEPRAVTGLRTGFPSLDNKLTGLHGGELVLLASRPGVGKTALALNIAQQAARFNGDGTVVAYFSLEMPYTQLVERMLSTVGGIDLGNIRSGRLSNDDWDNISNAADELGRCDIYIDDSSAITVMEMLSKCRRLRIERGLSLIVVDYLQLISSAGTGRRESRQQEITEITRYLKVLAMELDVPVLLISQLSRATEQRQSHRPILSDLRESGSIEQDADVVLFIFRQDYYAQEGTQQDPSAVANEAEIIVSKHRNGSTGSIKMLWDGAKVRFIETPYDYGPEQ